MWFWTRYKVLFSPLSSIPSWHCFHVERHMTSRQLVRAQACESNQSSHLMWVCLRDSSIFSNRVYKFGPSEFSHFFNNKYVQYILIDRKIFWLSLLEVTYDLWTPKETFHVVCCVIWLATLIVQQLYKWMWQFESANCDLERFVCGDRFFELTILGNNIKYYQWWNVFVDSDAHTYKLV